MLRRCAMLAVTGAVAGAANAQIFDDFVSFTQAVGCIENVVTADDQPHTTLLDDQYAGVRFNKTAQAWNAINFGGGGTAVSGSNVLFNVNLQPMRAEFDQPVVAVGVFNPSNFDEIRLRFLRADDSVIQTVDMPTSIVTFRGFASTEPIHAMTAEGIAGASNFTIFLDDLQWALALPACEADIADDFGVFEPDAFVTFGDFLALLTLLGPCGAGTANESCTGDIADAIGAPCPDGLIDFGDFLSMLGLLGPCE